MLQAKAAVIEFGKMSVISSNSTGPFDKMTGVLSSYVNEFIRDLGMNLTLTSARETGSCDVPDRPCTGIRGMLQRHEIDFSLSTLPLAYDNIHDYSPIMQSSSIFFTQLPSQEAMTETAGIMKYLVDYTPDSMVLVYVFYFVSFLLLNMKLHRHGIFFLKVYSVMNLWQLMMMHPQKSVKSVHRRIVLRKSLINLFSCIDSIITSSL